MVTSEELALQGRHCAAFVEIRVIRSTESLQNLNVAFVKYVVKISHFLSMEKTLIIRGLIDQRNC